MRAMNATTNEASVTDGRITCCQLPVPPAGSHFRMTEKTTTSMMPSQNTGMDIPKSEAMVTR